MKLDYINEHLETLRQDYLKSNNPEKYLGSSEIVINGSEFKQNIWIDENGNGKLVVFELVRKKVLISNHYALALQYSDAGDLIKLSNEQLWEIGIS